MTDVLARSRPEPTVLQALRSPRLLTREILAGLVVAIAGVRAVVELADGAVYVDDRGRVVRLLEDGARATVTIDDRAACLRAYTLTSTSLARSLCWVRGRWLLKITARLYNIWRVASSGPCMSGRAILSRKVTC